MINSMTAFASRTLEDEKISKFYAIDILFRGLNSRFFDLTIRLPNELVFLENCLRKLIAGRICRGKIEVKIELAYKDIISEKRISYGALDILRKLVSECSVYFPHARPLSVQEILDWPGVVSNLSDESLDKEILQKSILSLANSALSDFIFARTREGEHLGLQLKDLLMEINSEISHLRGQLPMLILDYRERMEIKLKELSFRRTTQIPSESIDAKKTQEGVDFSDYQSNSSFQSPDYLRNLEQEVFLHTLRSDISEEIVRMEAHISEAFLVLKSSGAIGRRLDFLAQEMNREVNTIASKSLATIVTKSALACKLAIERFREQVQNIE